MITGVAAFAIFYFLSDFFRIISPILRNQYSAQEGVLSIIELIPSHIVTVAPVGVLIGCLMFSNKMASSLEIIALKTSGISLKRIMKYPMIVTFIFSLGLLWVNVEVGPKLTYASNILQHRSNGEIKESPILNSSYMQAGNFYYYFQQVDLSKKTFTLMEAVELAPDRSHIVSVYSAQRGVEQNGNWSLYQVTKNTMSPQSTQSFATMSGNSIMKIEFKEMVQRTVTPASTTPFELYKIIHTYNFTIQQQSELFADFYEAFIYPFMSFFTCFLGFALGSRYVRGGVSINLAMAVIIGYSFFVINSIFLSIAGNPIFPTLIVILIPKLLAFVTGLYFMSKAEH